MIYFLYGSDQFRAREEMHALRDRLDSDGNLAHNTQRLEGKSLTPSDLRSAAHTASFFAETRLVIVEGLQERFKGTRRRRSTKAAAGAAVSELDQFIDVLENTPPTTTVVLMDESAPAALVEALGSKAKALQFNRLQGAELRSWASARAKAHGANLTPPAMERLLSLVNGKHLGQIAQEIDKLVTYTGGRAVQAEDVDTIVSPSIDPEIWDLTDAVMQGRGERAIAVYMRMDAKDKPLQMRAYMLVRQYRQLLLAQALLRDGLSQNQIGEKLGIRGYPLTKTIEQASRYPTDRLETAYRKLLASDVAVKTGVLDIEVSLEMLIIELSELGRSRVPARTATTNRPAGGTSWRR